MSYKLNKSFWEVERIESPDICLVGGGIVGINAAISIKSKNPTLKVVVIERNWAGGGASVKNAGFVCYGSPTELLDDIAHFGKEYAIELLHKRWNGAQLLRSIVGDADLDYNETGGIEYFSNNDIIPDVTYLNELLYENLGFENYFEQTTQQRFSNLNKDAISIKKEGRCNPGKMMHKLYKLAVEAGVMFIFEKVTKLDFDKKVIYLEDFGSLNYGSIAFTTNGYTQSVIDSDVKPARNLVLVTEPIQNLDFDQVAHFDQGYIYFRAIGNRLLLGGGRNIDLENEFKDEISLNQKIEAYLLDFLYNKLGVEPHVKIEHKWVGILGFGNTKLPEIKTIGPKAVQLAGLGGMGVAIGSQLGQDLAEYLMKNE